MKSVLALLSIGLVSTLAFGQASDRCLEEATDRQLVNEIERRLYLGGGGEEGGAIANFFCDSSTYFSISLVSQAGRESTDRIYVGNPSMCQDTVSELRSVNQINRLVIVAVCDSSAYLHRYTLNPDGMLNQLDRRYIGNVATCAQERSAINTRT